MTSTPKFIVEYAQFRNGEFAGWIEVGTMSGPEVAAWCKARGFRKGYGTTQRVGHRVIVIFPRDKLPPEEEDRNDTWMASRA